MLPKTRVDRLVKVRERSEGSALENLARAQRSLGRASDRLDAVRAISRSDGRAPGAAAMWQVEETAQVRAVEALGGAVRAVQEATRGEAAARGAYAAAWRAAETARRLQERQALVLKRDRERRDEKASDDLATMRYNGRR